MSEILGLVFTYMKEF